MRSTVLHVSPHPDDELAGAPAALFALRDAGFRIVNLACGLGRQEQRSRREAELREATGRSGFDLRLPDEQVAMSRTDDLTVAYNALAHLVDEAIDDERPKIVVSPQPHDRHHAHEVTACAVRDIIERRGEGGPRWWMWALWGDLVLPTIAVGFDERRLEEILTALAAYEGELERNDYRRLIRGRSEMNASRAPELIFGFGSPGAGEPYVDVLTEVVFAGGYWQLGTPQWLDSNSPLREPGGTEIGEWLHRETIAQRYGPPGIDGMEYSMDDAGRDRLWEHRLHEDGQFNQRLNFFLIGEAMLVVAATQVLTGNDPKPVLGIGISGVGLGLTLVWLYVNLRLLRLMRHLHVRALRWLPDFRDHYRKRPRARVSSTEVLCYGVPGIVLVVWGFILWVSVGAA